MNNEQLPINNSSSSLSRPLSPSPLLPLYAALSADPSIGIVGPELRYGDGAPQPSARRFPTPWTGFFESTWLGRAWPGNPWARAMLMADWPGDVRGDSDWLVGAALCCRRAALESVATPDGPFDEGFFMYSEELDLCRRIKLAGWRVVYEPAALVIHHEGKSSEQVSTQRHIRFNTSKVRYWRKWFGPGLGGGAAPLPAARISRATLGGAGQAGAGAQAGTAPGADCGVPGSHRKRADAKARPELSA